MGRFVCTQQQFYDFKKTKKLLSYYLQNEQWKWFFFLEIIETLSEFSGHATLNFLMLNTLQEIFIIFLPWVEGNDWTKFLVSTPCGCCSTPCGSCSTVSSEVCLVWVVQIETRAVTRKQVWLIGSFYVKTELGNVNFLEIWDKGGCREIIK